MDAFRLVALLQLAALVLGAATARLEGMLKPGVLSSTLVKRKSYGSRDDVRSRVETGWCRFHSSLR